MTSAPVAASCTVLPPGGCAQIRRPFAFPRRQQMRRDTCRRILDEPCAIVVSGQVLDGAPVREPEAAGGQQVRSQTLCPCIAIGCVRSGVAQGQIERRLAAMDRGHRLGLLATIGGDPAFGQPIGEILQWPGLGLDHRAVGGEAPAEGVHEPGEMGQGPVCARERHCRRDCGVVGDVQIQDLRRHDLDQHADPRILRRLAHPFRKGRADAAASAKADHDDGPRQRGVPWRQAGARSFLGEDVVERALRAQHPLDHRQGEASRRRRLPGPCRCRRGAACGRKPPCPAAWRGEAGSSFEEAI